MEYHENNQIELAKSILESKGYKVSKIDYEEYTEEQFNEILDTVEGRVEDIAEELKDTADEDDFNELMDELDELSSQLSAIEEYLTDEQYQRSEELSGLIYSAENTDFSGEPVDPYAERGLSRSDFY